MSVSQKDIAEYLGMDRSTVTKVLNRDPRYSASERTRELIFRTAEQLGYDFTAIRRPYKREYGRVAVNARSRLELRTGAGELFDEGTAEVRNLSVGGALLANISTARMVLPLQPFSIRLRLLDLPGLADLEGECELVRIGDRNEEGQPHLGVRFVKVALSDRRRIREFVEEKLRREQQAPGLPPPGAGGPGG
jgi:transcriptional regulator with XRE-family HTH domain